MPEILLTHYFLSFVRKKVYISGPSWHQEKTDTDFLGFSVICFSPPTEAPCSFHPDHHYKAVRAVALQTVSAESAIPTFLPCCPLLGNKKESLHINHTVKLSRETILSHAQTVLPMILFSPVPLPSVDGFL